MNSPLMTNLLKHIGWHFPCAPLMDILKKPILFKMLFRLPLRLPPPDKTPTMFFLAFILPTGLPILIQGIFHCPFDTPWANSPGRSLRPPKMLSSIASVDFELSVPPKKLLKKKAPYLFLFICYILFSNRSPFFNSSWNNFLIWFKSIFPSIKNYAL